MSNSYPENIEKLAGSLLQGEELLVIDRKEQKWEVPHDIVQKLKIEIEIRALAQFLGSIESDQEIAYDYPETPDLFEYLKREGSQWIMELLQEGADETTVRAEIRNQIESRLISYAEDLLLLAEVLRGFENFADYDWEKKGRS
jgi:hypothetical protein